MVFANNTSLSDKWNKYRNGQNRNCTRRSYALIVTIRVPIVRKRCLILFIKHYEQPWQATLPLNSSWSPKTWQILLWLLWLSCLLFLMICRSIGLWRLRLVDKPTQRSWGLCLYWARLLCYAALTMVAHTADTRRWSNAGLMSAQITILIALGYIAMTGILWEYNIKIIALISQHHVGDNNPAKQWSIQI